MQETVFRRLSLGIAIGNLSLITNLMLTDPYRSHEGHILRFLIDSSGKLKGPSKLPSWGHTVNVYIDDTLYYFYFGCFICNISQYNFKPIIKTNMLNMIKRLTFINLVHQYY